MEENYINLIRAFKKLDIEDKKEEIIKKLYELINLLYLENKKNMTELDTLMDKYYPGLSRGIYERKAYYNQDLNKNIMLIELGAKENTIEEVTNTIDALTFIFNKYINGDDK